MPKTVSLLPARLQKLTRKDFLTDEQFDKLSSIIFKAEQGHYHDFKSPLATPKIQLVQDLDGLGLHDIAEDVREGAYD